MKTHKLILIFLLITLVVACGKKELEYEFPEFESKIAIESYLIPGAPFLVSISETIPYLDSPSVQHLKNATVEIEFNNKIIQLFETQDGVYKSLDTVPFDYESIFNLRVEDQKGRIASASTRIAKPVQIDSVKFLFNSDQKAAASIYFNDDSTVENFYRLYLFYRESARFSDKEYNGKTKPYISNYVLQEGEKVDIKFIHITRECYEYFVTSYNAYMSNVRPLIEPGQIKGNITGGVGIFTGVSLDEKFLTVTR